MNIKRIVIGIIFVLVLIQFIPVQRNDSQTLSPLQAPENVKKILRKSCYDCHSNETQWPMYSSVAPVSWLIAQDVREAREHLNFSLWSSYKKDKKNELAEEIYEEISEGEMPLGRYLLMHKEARLSQSDVAILVRWLNNFKEIKGKKDE